MLTLTSLNTRIVFEASDTAKSYLVGRSEEADFRLIYLEVSRKHAEVFYMKNGYWYITDHKSLNGTYVNGHEVPPGDGIPLQQGDTVRIGPFNFNVSVSEPTDEPTLVPA